MKKIKFVHKIAFILQNKKQYVTFLQINDEISKCLMLYFSFQTNIHFI